MIYDELRTLAEAAVTDEEIQALHDALDPDTVVALLDRIDAVRALHEVYQDEHLLVCNDCCVVWPCPTIRALGVS